MLLQALTVGGLVSPVPANAELAAPKRKALDATLAALVHDSARPLAGLSVLLIQDGQTVYEGQWGSRRIGRNASEPALPVDADTLFRVASVSKLTVAVAAMKLAEQGRLNLDAALDRYLGFELRHPAHPRTPLTARLLLTHRSSLGDAAGYSFKTPAAMRRALASPQAWSAHAPGSYFAYANLNLGVLAGVMEAITGLRFDRLMRELLFAPLGLEASFNLADLSVTQMGNLAALYAKRHDGPDGQQWQPQAAWQVTADDFRGRLQAEAGALKHYVPGSNGSLMGPQGGLRISLRELARLMQMLLNLGVWQGRALLQPDSVKQLLQPHWRRAPNGRNDDDLHGLFNAWALGLQQFTDRSDPPGPGTQSLGDRLTQRGGLQGFGHLGEAYGLLSGFIFDPQRRWGVIYAINGVSDNPVRYLGRYSSFSRWEESLLNHLLSALPTA